MHTDDTHLIEILENSFNDNKQRSNNGTKDTYPKTHVIYVYPSIPYSKPTKQNHFSARKIFP